MAIPTILSGAAGRAFNTLKPLTKPTGPLDALVLVHRATPDMRAALGSEAAQALGKTMFDAARRGSTRTAASRESIRLGLDTLEAAARQTALKRVAIGSLAAGTGIGGYLLLRDRIGGGESPMAPGPLEAPGAPDLPSNRQYA